MRCERIGVATAEYLRGQRRLVVGGAGRRDEVRGRLQDDGAWRHLVQAVHRAYDRRHATRLQDQSFNGGLNYPLPASCVKPAAVYRGAARCCTRRWRWRPRRPRTRSTALGHLRTRHECVNELKKSAFSLEPAAC